MKKNPTTVNSPMVRIVAPSAVLATGLLSPIAWPAPGDLDPAFGDVGRVHSLPALWGAAWTVEDAQEDDVLFGGFEYYCSYYSFYECDLTGYAGRLNADGTVDPGFAADRLGNIAIFDVALQTDGKAVGIGTSSESGVSRLTVFRLNPDGSLDAGFGGSGIVHVGDPAGPSHHGQSLVLDPDGGIVVAGLRGDRLIVVRFLANGSVDAAFGANGVFLGPFVQSGGSPSRLVRTATGYRIAAHIPSSGATGTSGVQCQVIGVSTRGELDPSFGTVGLPGPALPGASVDDCAALAVQPDDRLVVVGSRRIADDEQAFAVRLLPSGALDLGFSGAAVSSAMRRATALAVDDRGAIAVAGHDKNGLSGALVVRLQADGLLDSVFGNAGSTFLELPGDGDVWLDVRDLQANADGSLLLGGGERSNYRQRPFLVRLLGEAAGGGPGVLDMRAAETQANEAGQQAVMHVRRIGGSTGAVSVAYQTRPDTDRIVGATPGQDYTEVRGRLEWADGDSSDKSILVPLATGEAVKEGEEYFSVQISDPQGGAGLGTIRTRVAILGDGYPAGLLTIAPYNPIVSEGTTVPVAVVTRQYYAQGEVSVTVRTVGGTATPGADFDDRPFTLFWGDGDSSSRYVYLPVHADRLPEGNETLSVTLAEVEGGAFLDTRSSVEISVADAVESGKSGGGGHFGGLLAMLLGFAGLQRRRHGRV